MASGLRRFMITEKFKIKKDHKLKVVNSPEGFVNLMLSEIPDLGINKKSKCYDAIIYFVKSKKELDRDFLTLAGEIANDGLFWISYAKKTSKIQTDLTMYSGWEILDANDYRGIAMISVDETWSSFRIRKKDLVNSQDRKNNPEAAKLIDSEKRVVKLPMDAAALLDKSEKGKEKFSKLSFTHRKEYVLWIVEAKKPETRAKRIKEFIKKLEK